MTNDQLMDKLRQQIQHAEHPRELLVDVLFALQQHYGYVSDKALEQAAELVKLDPLEVEEIATFYTFIYREPVGRYVIHVCDSVVCWMAKSESIRDYLCQKLKIEIGQTTSDGLFTILPVCCIGYCDRAPAILINGKVYGPLTTESIDKIIENLKTDAKPAEE